MEICNRTNEVCSCGWDWKKICLAIVATLLLSTMVTSCEMGIFGPKAMAGEPPLVSGSNTCPSQSCPPFTSGVYEEGYLIWNSITYAVCLMKAEDDAFVGHAEPVPEDIEAIITEGKRIPLWFAPMFDGKKDCFCIREKK